MADIKEKVNRLTTMLDQTIDLINEIGEEDKNVLPPCIVIAVNEDIREAKCATAGDCEPLGEILDAMFNTNKELALRLLHAGMKRKANGPLPSEEFKND